MKKLITKFWGLALIVVLLTSLFVGAVPVSAGNYALANTFGLPSGLFGDTVMAPAAGFGFLDVAQSGSIMYATAQDGAGVDYLYKSSNGGASWAPVASAATWIGAGVTTDVWGIIAVAPDDPNVIAIVDTNPAGADIVYLSTSAGAVFSALTANAADLNAIAISPTNGFARYITVGGATTTAGVAGDSGTAYVRTWTVGAVAPAWLAPGFGTANVFTPTLTVGTNAIPAAATSAVADNLTLDDVQEVAFSSNFLADQALFIVTESVGTAGGVIGEIALHVYSFNTSNWDAAIDVSFPESPRNFRRRRNINNAAEIALDANFFLADEAAQIGFIGADITTPAATQAGGVYRIGTYAVVTGDFYLTQIMVGTAIRSVAWDGTNLMAAQNAAGGIVWRSSTALGVVPAFLQNSTLKAATTGTIAEVLFNGTTGYALSNGTTDGAAKSTDLGKSWNGYALNPTTSFATISDFWVSPDASVKYFTCDNGVDKTVWRQTGFTYERIMILAGVTGGAGYLVRADADNPANVYIGRATATNMYKSTDSGDFTWTARSASMAIADFAVQDANTVYIGSGPFVAKSTNGAFTWGFPTAIPFIAGGGNVYSLNLIANDNLLVGGTTGGAAYSADGGATYTGVGGIFNLAGTNVVLTADKLTAGGNIYGVASGAGASVNRYTIGTSFLWTAGQATAGAGAMGIVLSNGVLYVLDDTGAFLYRILNPAVDILAVTGSQATAEAGAYVMGINKLQASAAGTTSTVWAITIGSLDNFVDYQTSPSNAPAPVYPINNAKIDINSISGAVAAFTFQWNAPTIITAPPAVAYRYDIQVFLDEAGTIPVTALVTTPALGTLAPTLSAASAVTVGFAGVPGETYYWRVRISFVGAAGAAGTAMNSYYSPMATFTVQQLTAIVPTISSPQNGATIAAGLTPAFSWSPISGAATYKFELDTGTAFTAPLYSATLTSAGAGLPATIKLVPGKTYFWRVKALTPTEGEWSTVGNFIVAEPVVVTTPPPAVTPTLTVVIPPGTTITTSVVIPPATTTEVNPTYIWAIIIIGAVLVIAVIVLIVRTRRSV